MDKFQIWPWEICQYFISEGQWFEEMIDFMNFRFPKEKKGFLLFFGGLGLYLWKTFKNLKSIYQIYQLFGNINTRTK